MQSFPRKEDLFPLKMVAVPECVRSYVIDIQKRFERGNHNGDGLDYTVFRLDWVIF